MKIALLDLNIEGGRFFDQVVAYIKSNDFDIITLQEVAAGKFSKGPLDTFSAFMRQLSYKGELAKVFQLSTDPSSYVAQATFFKPQFKLKEKKIIWLKKGAAISSHEIKPQDLPRNALSLTLEIEGKEMTVVNAHLAWGPTPTDEPYKLEQAKYLYAYMQTLHPPFLLTGDFNLTNDSQVVHWIQSLTRDLTTENKIQNTLNPHTHRVQKLFPKGLAVDYLFVDTAMRVDSFSLVDTPDLSDHFGLQAQVEV